MVVFRMKPKTSQKTTFGVHRVSPAQAKRWREEMDHGIPATEIAEREHCDPRTVLKHVARARRARGSSSAREELLRDALRAHQDDLAAVAKSLALQFRRGFPPNPVNSPDGLPTSALAEHLGKTPSGKALGRWSALADQYPILEKELLRRTEQDSKIAALVARGVSQFSLPQQVVRLAEGMPLDSMSNVASGGSDADALNAERTVILRGSEEWAEFKNVRNCLDEAGVLARGLVDRLDVLRLRRYITGSCRYCPDAEGD